ncbi:hypothetical protein PIB30_085421 [Stylosanthes scabra]|uniref:Uncharacterized protein n=1 Tax=Stylosanthes scabra TaxID=79078 RepID=A0ABU6QSE2_9FABA|nr:hypothetical protein [Stylosanthes scabra]
MIWAYSGDGHYEVQVFVHSIPIAQRISPCTCASRRVKQKRKKKMMDEMTKNQPSHWWWLQFTLSDLFAKLAKMYYKKMPELLRMVEDFYD